MSYSITWTCDGQTVTQTFDARSDFFDAYDRIDSDSSCTMTQYVNGAARWDINDPPVIDYIV